MGLNIPSRVSPRPLPYKPTTSPPPSPVASLQPRRKGSIRRSESAIFTPTTTLKLSTRPSHHPPLRRTVSATCYFGEGSGTSSSSSSNPNEEFSRQIEQFAREEPTLFDSNHHHTMIPSPSPRPPTAATSSSFRTSKLDLLEPSELGIRPDPPDWPARDELIRHQIARRANCIDIPLSVRMIMKKRQQQRRELLKDEKLRDGVGVGIMKAFSSTVSVIREMQNQALILRGLALDEDFESISGTAELEMNSSFVWLFREVFSRTPDLMLDVMMLTVDFTSVSVQNLCNVQAEVEAALVASEEEVEELVVEVSEEEEEEEEEGIIETDQSALTFVPQPVRQKEESSVFGKEYPNAVDYEVYYRTDLFYQMGISKEPDNALLLSNYAQFLYLVSHDYDRAEECYKRAIQLEPTDPEAMSRYAKFLWKIRDDLWGAEDMFQRAAAADPDNSYHVSNYAHFLWSTGADDTCYPLDQQLS